MIDITTISIKAGRGGKGCVSFRREKFVPRGGPDGGDGGDGGSVFIVGDTSLNTLLHLKYHTTWRGDRGAHGGSKKRRGANGDNLKIPVPIGTVVWRITGEGEREFVTDITGSEPVLVARGGAGGMGNLRFVSATHREPVLAEMGEEGEDAGFLLELKLLADVGLIGQPNSGKSTLLSHCSAAKPKIASYPFTTLDPVLGVVSTREKSFVMMEVPGLIEGAHNGTGLGHEFLRHAERTRLLLHIIDGTADDPIGDWRLVNRELNAFDINLGKRPQLVVLNKVDIPTVRDRMPAVKVQLEAEGAPVFVVSAATGEGLEKLLDRTLQMLDRSPRVELQKAPSSLTLKVVETEEPFRVTRHNRAYVVHARRIERMLPMVNLKDHRAMIQIWAELRSLGVVKVLEEKGVQPGDTVRLGKVELEWF